MSSVNFVFCLHNHQPVDNFDHVLEKATNDSYLPFLERMERHPKIKFVAHYSGPLLEWFLDHRPDVIAKLKAMSSAGQLELMGGGLTEPIFAMLPERDALGQLARMNELIQAHFGHAPKGIWLPERVWEPSLASLLAKAGVRYTVLDDFHFRAAGLRDEQLTGPYLTEDRGALLQIFPLKEDLRYSIPYKDPQWTIDYLLRYADESGSKTLVYADDGEKFGVWPRTKEHVFGEGWLDRFLEALDRNADRVRTTTFHEAIRARQPLGRVYLPAASYREMGEWSMLNQSQGDFEGLLEELRRQNRFDGAKPFLPGGTWRNFKVKYPEANLMYGRMMSVSRRVDDHHLPAATRREIETELYKGQCNCGYWHGVFGGLYLPHLRNSVYRHLILAERLLDKAVGHLRGIEPVDIDLDGHADLRVFSETLNLFVSPVVGGSVVAFDYRPEAVNYGASLARHREHYHAKVRQAVVAPTGQAASIHDVVLAKQADLDRHLVYDSRPRASLIDHFFEPGATAADAARNNRETGDFAGGVYQHRIGPWDGAPAVMLEREGVVRRGDAGDAKVLLKKAVQLDETGREAHFHYSIRNLSSAPLVARFGIEFNAAAMSPTAPDAFFEADRGALGIPQVYAKTREVAIHDGWRNVRVLLRTSSDADVWCFPINTVSQSESGFELVYQGTVVMPTWSLSLEAGGAWTASVVLTAGPGAAHG